MKVFLSAQELAPLREEAAKLQYWRDASSIQMSSLPGTLPAWLSSAPSIQKAVAEIEGLTDGEAVGVMLNRLDAGASVPEHADAGEGDRWHLPITTNPDCFWWDDQQGSKHLHAGQWWQVTPSRSHRVWNHGTSPRVHLVVDVRSS